MRYKRFFIFLVPFILFLSCSLFEKKKPEIMEYFPLEVGNYWDYEFSELTEDENGNPIWKIRDTIRLKIVGKERIKGEEFFEMWLTFWDEDFPTEVYYLRAEPEYLLIYYPWNPEDIIDTLLYHPEHRKEWFLQGMDWNKDGFPYRATYQQNEIVSLPIGNFDCLKVVYHVSNIGPPSGIFYFDLSWEGNVNYIWYAKGIGMTKILNKDVFEGEVLDSCELRLKRYGLKK